MKKELLSLAIGCTAIFAFSITSFAASKVFTADLPKNQGDTEVATVRKENTNDYFTVQMYKIGSEINSVNAWTEGSFGGNYSSPYNEVTIGTNTIDYDDQPNENDNVTLNLDNPVYMSKTVAVKGKFMP